MKSCHNLSVRVFAKQDDDEERIKETLANLFPFPLNDETEKVHLERTVATGVDEQSRIIIYEINLTKDRHINAFLEKLSAALSEEQKALLIRQTNRLDDNHYFFLRLDKRKLMDGIYWLTDSGDCFHIRMCIATYPKNRENCYAVVKQIFK
ncbi:MAG: RNA-binding domain-containing protein [Nanoarchaeota archaeon]